MASASDTSDGLRANHCRQRIETQRQTRFASIKPTQLHCINFAVHGPSLYGVPSWIDPVRHSVRPSILVSDLNWKKEKPNNKNPH